MPAGAVKLAPGGLPRRGHHGTCSPLTTYRYRDAVTHDLAPASLPGVVDPLLERAGELALRWFRTGLVADDKGGVHGYDPVTEADRGIEDLLRDGLHTAFPDHQVVGEERGVSGPADARHRWFIDPIDGTKAFVSGSPLWGVLLGLVEDGRAVAGWLHQPYIGETFSAVAGTAAMRRGEQRVHLRTRQDGGLDTAVMYTTFPGMFQTNAEQEAFARLSERVRLMRFGGDCYAYALLTMGFVDLVVEASLAPYDIVPIIPLVEAAGGVITDRDGNAPLAGGFVVASANPQVHEQALAVIG